MTEHRPSGGIAELKSLDSHPGTVGITREDLMTRRTRKPAPTGPLAEVFGVRHLSPNGAFQLSRCLARLDPTAVLIEGPSDASGFIEHFGHAQTRCPIALFAWSQRAPGAAQRSVVYPFARYSPEWIAATWALTRGRRVSFIDLPATTLLALDQSPEVSPVRGEESLDPFLALCSISGEKDHDTWWEKNFEHASAEDAYRHSLRALGAELRLMDPGSVNARQNTLREAYMRRSIRRVLAEGHEASRVLVVCGAFHADALTWELSAMTDGEARKLPKSKASMSLMPYGYRRMSTQGGSSAGNRAPAYFEMLYDALGRGSLEALPAIFLSRLAAEMRARGSQRSSAEVIEAVRLAQGLGALGGASAPTLGDLHDAAVCCLGGGDASVIREAFERVAVGERVGAVPKAMERTGLREDFQRQLEALKLDGYLTQTAERAESQLVLDRRMNRGVKREVTASRDRDRSVFLHRLASLDVDFAREITEASDRRDNTFKERWSLGWTPEGELRLAESAQLGDSVERAAERCLHDKIDRAETVGEAASLGLTSRDCDLGGCLERAALRVQSLTLSEAGFSSVAEGVWKIARMIREPDVTGLDVGALRPLLAQLFLRAALRVESAARCDDAAAKPLGEAMDDVHRVSRYDWDPGELALDRWCSALHALTLSDDANSYISGVSCALLLESAKIDDAALERWVSRRISPAMEPQKVAGCFEGLSSRNPYALLSREGLWRAMTVFVESLNEREFMRALPGLRRAFAGFSPGEARAAAAAVGRAWRGRDTHEKSHEIPIVIGTPTLGDEALEEVSAVLDGIDFG